MIKVSILKEAGIELYEAVEYYEEKSKGLGLDLLKEIKTAVEIIRRFPECSALRKKDETRRYLINRFPYLIIYTYNKNHIWIIAIAHCKRKEFWAKRIEK